MLDLNQIKARWLEGIKDQDKDDMYIQIFDQLQEQVFDRQHNIQLQTTQYILNEKFEEQQFLMEKKGQLLGFSKKRQVSFRQGSIYQLSKPPKNLGFPQSCLLEEFIKTDPFRNKREALAEIKIYENDIFKPYHNLLFPLDQEAIRYLLKKWLTKSYGELRYSKQSLNNQYEMYQKQKIQNLSYIYSNQKISGQSQPSIQSDEKEKQQMEEDTRKRVFRENIELFLNYDKQQYQKFSSCWFLLVKKRMSSELGKKFVIKIQLGQLKIGSKLDIMDPCITVMLIQEDKSPLTESKTVFNTQLDFIQEDDLHIYTVNFLDQYNYSNSTDIYDVDIGQQLQITLTDKNQIIENNILQSYTIVLSQIIDLNYSQKNFWVKLKSEQKEAEEQQEPSILYVTLIFKHNNQSVTSEPKLLENYTIINDPYYSSYIVYPNIKSDQISVASSCMKSKDKNYFNILKNLEIIFNACNHKILIFVQKQLDYFIVENLCSLFLDKDKQMEQFGKLISFQKGKEIDEILILILNNKSFENGKSILQELTLYGFPQKYRKMMWFNILDIPSMITQVKKYLSDANFCAPDNVLTNKSDCYKVFHWLSQVDLQGNIDIDKIIEYNLQKDKQFQISETIIKLSFISLMKCYLTYCEIYGVDRNFAHDNFMQIYLLAQNIVISNLYFYLDKELEYPYDKKMEIYENTYNLQEKINKILSLNMMILLTISDKLLFYFDNKKHLNLVLKTCIYMDEIINNFLPQIRIKLIQMDLDPVYCFNNLFRTLFSELFSSEYIYRLWDLIFFMHQTDPQNFHLILCSILFTFMKRVEKKISQIMMKSDLGFIMKTEGLLCGQTWQFHRKIYKNFKKIKKHFEGKKLQIPTNDLISIQELDILNFDIEFNPKKIKKSNITIQLSKSNPFDQLQSKQYPNYISQFQHIMNKQDEQKENESDSDSELQDHNDEIFLVSNSHVVQVKAKKMNLLKLIIYVFFKKIFNQELMAELAEKLQNLKPKNILLLNPETNKFSNKILNKLQNFKNIQLYSHHNDQIRNIFFPDHASKVQDVINFAIQKLKIGNKLLRKLLEQRELLLQIFIKVQDLIVLEIKNFTFINMKKDINSINQNELTQQLQMVQKHLLLLAEFFMTAQRALIQFDNQVEYKKGWKEDDQNKQIIMNMNYPEYCTYMYDFHDNLLQRFKNLKQKIFIYTDNSKVQIKCTQDQYLEIIQNLEDQSKFFLNSQIKFQCLFFYFIDDIQQIIDIAEQNQYNYLQFVHEFRKNAEELKNGQDIVNQKLLHLSYEISRIKSKLLDIIIPFNLQANDEIVKKCILNLKSLKTDELLDLIKLDIIIQDHKSFFLLIKTQIAKEQQIYLKNTNLQLIVLQHILNYIKVVEQHEKDLKTIQQYRQYLSSDGIDLNEYDKNTYNFSLLVKKISLANEQLQTLKFFMPQLKCFSLRLSNEYTNCQNIMNQINEYYVKNTSTWTQTTKYDLEVLFVTIKNFKEKVNQKIQKKIKYMLSYEQIFNDIEKIQNILFQFIVLRQLPKKYQLNIKSQSQELNILKNVLIDLFCNDYLTQILTYQQSIKAINSSDIKINQNIQLEKNMEEISRALILLENQDSTVQNQDYLDRLDQLYQKLLHINSTYLQLNKLYKEQHLKSFNTIDKINEIFYDLDSKLFMNKSDVDNWLQIPIQKFMNSTKEAFSKFDENKQFQNQIQIFQSQDPDPDGEQQIDYLDQVKLIHEIIQKIEVDFNQSMKQLEEEELSFELIRSQMLLLFQLKNEVEKGKQQLINVEQFVADISLYASIDKAKQIEQMIIQFQSIHTFCQIFSTIQENILMDKNLNQSRVQEQFQTLDKITNLLEYQSSDTQMETILNLQSYFKDFITQMKKIWTFYLNIFNQFAKIIQKIPRKLIQVYDQNFAQNFNELTIFFQSNEVEIQKLGGTIKIQSQFIQQFLDILESYWAQQQMAAIGGLSISDLIELNKEIQFITPRNLHKFSLDINNLKQILSNKSHTLLFTDIKNLIEQINKQIQMVNSNIFKFPLHDKYTRSFNRIDNLNVLNSFYEGLCLSQWELIIKHFAQFYTIFRSKNDIIIMKTEQKRFQQLLKDKIQENKFQDEIKTVFGCLIDICDKIISQQ